MVATQKQTRRASSKSTKKPSSTKPQLTKVRAAKGRQVVQEDLSSVSPTTKVRPASVRQTVRAMLQAGKSTPDITATLQAQFPDTAAAKKAAKHIAYYRCQLKAEGSKLS